MQSQELNRLTTTLALMPDPDRHLRAGRFMPGSESLDRMFQIAITEGIAPLLYKNLIQSDTFAALDNKNREKLQTLYFRSLHTNLRLIHAVKNILVCVNRENMRIILLQGISLLHQVYDDIGLRPLTDIDLWVLERDAPVLKRILQKSGYEQDPLYPLTFKNGPISIDLQTHILWADRIKARQFIINTKQEDLFQKAQMIDFEGQKAYCLDPFDQIIYLGLHLLKHNAERIIWLVDIYRLMAAFDSSNWEALLVRAKELGQTKCIAYIVFLIENLLGHQLPEPARLLGRNLNAVEKKILRQRIEKGSLPKWSTLFLLSSGKGLKKGFTFIAETLYPRPDILRQVFSDTPALNTRRLYTKRTRQLIGMARSVLK